MKKRWLILLAVLFTFLHLIAFFVASGMSSSSGKLARVLFFPGILAGGCLYAFFPFILLLNSALWGITLALLTSAVVRTVRRRKT
jgi:hypothetical protein